MDKMSEKQIARYAYMIRTLTACGMRGKEKKVIDADLRERHALTSVMAEVKRQNKIRQARANRPSPLPLREQLRAAYSCRIAAVISDALPRVIGAGRRIIRVDINPSCAVPQLEHSTRYGDSNSVAKSYGIVRDHVHKLTIAPSMRVAIVSGVLTIYRRDADLRRGAPCWWAERVRRNSYDMRLVAGYVVRGVHVRARSLGDAQRRVAADRARAAADAWRRRIIERQRVDVLSRVWVGREDSVSAGNCPAGTDAFIARLIDKMGIVAEIGAMRADVLLSMAHTLGQVYYVERAINYALSARYQ